MNRDREAIARAIYGCDWTCGSLWENCSQTLRNEYLAKADAILALPEEMLDASWRQAGESGEMRARYHERMRVHWRVMLAALSPTTLGGRSGSAQDGLPPARSLPSALPEPSASEVAE